MRKVLSLGELKVGDKLKLRCGGTVQVSEVGSSDQRHYPIALRFEGFHADGREPWPYDNGGECGLGINKCPFDVVGVTRTHVSKKRSKK